MWDYSSSKRICEFIICNMTVLKFCKIKINVPEIKKKKKEIELTSLFKKKSNKIFRFSSHRKWYKSKKSSTVMSIKRLVKD